MSDDFSHWQVAIIWALFAIVTFALVHNYAYRTTPWYVYLAVFIGWLFPFSVVLLLPLDLSAALYKTCLQEASDCEKPLLYVSEDFLMYSWKSIYWTMFVLTFLIIPFIMSYCDSGYFTVVDRAKKSIRANVTYYLILLGLGLVAVVWIIATNRLSQRDAILKFAMSLANIWGLLLLVLFLSFGLIEVPRSLWHSGNYRRSLRFLEYKAPQVKESLENCKNEFKSAVNEIYAISDHVPMSDQMRPFVNVVLEKCPLDHHLSEENTGRPRTRSDVDNSLDMAKLIQLHKKIIRCSREREKLQWEWDNLCKTAFHLQDIISHENDNNMKFYSSITPAPTGKFKNILPFISWIWYIKVQPLFFRFIAVLFGLLSAIILWSETTYLIEKPILSIIGAIYNSNGLSYAALEILSIVCLLYMCSCAIHSIFRVRIFNSYSLHPNHHSSEVSLCWFTNSMCRLTFPLGYNFMYLSVSKKTVLYQLMGDMVAANIQTFVPVLVVVIVIMNVFDVIGMIMRFLGLSDDFMNTDEDDDMGWGDVEEGKILISEARGMAGLHGSRTELHRGSSASLLDNAAGDERVNTITRPSTSTKPTTAATNQSSTRPSSTSSKWDPSKTTSKYLLNNPLYEKYQRKFKGESTNEEDDNRTSTIKTDTDVSPRSWGFGSSSTNNNNNNSDNSNSGGNNKKSKKLPDFENIWK